MLNGMFIPPRKGLVNGSASWTSVRATRRRVQRLNCLGFSTSCHLLTVYSTLQYCTKICLRIIVSIEAASCYDGSSRPDVPTHDTPSVTVNTSTDRLLLISRRRASQRALLCRSTNRFISDRTGPQSGFTTVPLSTGRFEVWMFDNVTSSACSLAHA
jgi:hypothetical protein